MNERMNLAVSLASQVARSVCLLWLTSDLQRLGFSVIVVGDRPDNFLSVASVDRENEAAVRVEVDDNADLRVTVKHRRGRHRSEMRSFGPSDLANVISHLEERLGLCSGSDAAERFGAS